MKVFVDVAVKSLRFVGATLVLGFITPVLIGQVYPAFPQPATEQSSVTSQGAYNIAQVPNSVTGSAILAVYATHNGGNLLGYSVLANGVTSVGGGPASGSLPGVDCYQLATCTAAVAVYNSTIYVAYADFSGNGINIATATPLPNSEFYGFNLVHTDFTVRPTTAPGMAVINGQLVITFGTSSDSRTSNAFYQINLVGSTWTAASESTLGASSLRVSSGQQPGMAALNGKLYMTMQENNSNHELFVYSTQDGSNWTFVSSVAGVQFNSGLTMVAYNGALVAVGEQNANGASLYAFSSTDGVNWGSQRYAGITVGATPGIALFNGGFALAIKSNDPTGTLFTDVASH